MLYLLAVFALASAVSAEPTTSVNFVFANMLGGMTAGASTEEPKPVDPVAPPEEPKSFTWTYGSYGLVRRLRYWMDTGVMNFQGESGHVMSYANPWTPYPNYAGFYARAKTAGWWWCGMNEFYGPKPDSLLRSFGAFSSHQYIYIHSPKIIKSSQWAMSKFDGPGMGTAGAPKGFNTDSNSYLIPLKAKPGNKIWVSKPNAGFMQIGPGYLNDKVNEGYFPVDNTKPDTSFMIYDKRHNVEYMVVMHDKIKDDMETWRMANMADGTMAFPEVDDARWTATGAAFGYGIDRTAGSVKNTFPAKGYGDDQLSAGVRVSIDYDMDLPFTEIADVYRAFRWDAEVPYVAYNQEQNDEDGPIF
jgi:hypothetical protein